jgi:cytochrome P450
MSKCECLRAVLHEVMRFCPPGPSEVERTILRGEITTACERYSERVTVGVPLWALSQHEGVFDDAATLRSERYVVSNHLDIFNSQEEVNRLKRFFFAYISQGRRRLPGSKDGNESELYRCCKDTVAV